jgi:hypothetical protein
MLSTA